MHKLNIVPFREKYYSNDTNYGVYYCELIKNLTPENNVYLHPKFESVTIVGSMPQLDINSNYIINCKEVESKFGRQYEFESVDVKKLSTSKEQMDYLLQLLTPLQVEEIMKVYEKPVDEIINNTFDYNKIRGIGSKLYPKIRKKIVDNYVFFTLLSELGKYGITYKQVRKLYQLYNDVELAIQAVKNNPYVLMELPNVGFIRADKIALKMGIEKNDRRRIISCIEFIINKENEMGHTWCNLNIVIDKVIDILGKDILLDIDISSYILENGKFTVIDNDKIILTSVYNTEKKIAKELYRIDANSSKINFDIDSFIKKQENMQGFTYDEKQREVFYNVINNNLFILTGAAGTGKSSVVNGLLNMFDECEKDYILLSPSAKAAKVLESYTKREAMTIHRGLIWTPHGFGYNEDEPLPYDIVVLDEVSMVGVYLFLNLLKAIDSNTKLILIGDPYQLPSIEPGSILDDILQSNKFNNIQLEKVFRQAEESGIINIATKTRYGKHYLKSKENEIVFFGENKDTVIMPGNKEKTVNNIMRTYKHLKNNKGYYDDDIMVLVPTRINNFGSLELNKLLQEINNPANDNKNEFEYGKNNKVIFREGDKVIHVKNNYKAEWLDINSDDDFYEVSNLGIFNGDIGRIYRIIDDNKDKLVYVDYGDKYILYENGDLEQLEHAWCMTTHKCITEDTWVFTDKGLIQLKELNNNAEIGKFKEIEEDIGIYNGSYLEQPKSFYNNGLAQCKNIITKRGYNIEATLEHRVDVISEDGYIIQKYVKDLTKNDYLIINKGHNIYGNSINLPNEWQIRPSYDIRTVIYNRPKIMTKEFARFLGYMVADGTLTNRGLKFSKSYKEVTEDFKELIFKLFKYKNGKIVYRNLGDYIYEVSSMDIANFCKNINGISPHNKFVPKCILEAPKEYQLEFLKALFEDGTVNIKNKNGNIKFDHIEFASKFRLLIEQVNMMLLNIGIVTTVSYNTGNYKKHKFDSWRMYIYGIDALLYKEQVNFISNFKKHRLEYTNNKYICSQNSIPYVTKILKKLLIKYNVYKYDCVFNKNKITYYRLKKYLELLKSKVVNDDIDYQYLLNISNLYIDKIEKISDIKIKPTYCLEMPKTHKFIQNGISAWNSQGSASKVVVVGLDSRNYFMAKRNWLYTAITRASELLIMCCDPSIVNKAINDDEVVKKRTLLKEFLIGSIN